MPLGMRHVTLWAKGLPLRALLLERILTPVLTSAALSCCIVLGDVTKSDWNALARTFYRIGNAVDIRMYVRIQVGRFQTLRGRPLRDANAFLWVAEYSHMIHHVLSHVTIEHEGHLLDSDWVKSKLGLEADVPM